MDELLTIPPTTNCRGGPGSMLRKLFSPRRLAATDPWSVMGKLSDPLVRSRRNCSSFGTYHGEIDFGTSKAGR